MTFGSEYIKILESYAKEQKPYEDLTFGVDYKSSYTNIRMACGELSKIYISEKQVANCYPDGVKKLWKTYIPIEVNDYDRHMYDGLAIEVTAVDEEYFNIKMFRAHRPANVEYMKDFDYEEK